MKRISILDDFGVWDISGAEEVTPMLHNMAIGDDSDIELDLSGCLLDYDGTGIIVDHIVEQLKTPFSQDKTLTIKTDYRMGRIHAIDTLFRKSRTLPFESTGNLDEGGIVSALHRKSEDLGFRIRIIAKDAKSGDDYEF